MRTLFLVTIGALLLVGCSVGAAPDSGDSTDQQMTIDQKVDHGINTGTPLDIYNRNPYSVYQPYSPWNPYQN